MVVNHGTPMTDGIRYKTPSHVIYDILPKEFWEEIVLDDIFQFKVDFGVFISHPLEIKPFHLE